MKNTPNGIKKYLDPHPSIKYLSLIENAFILCSKIDS